MVPEESGYETRVGDPPRTCSQTARLRDRSPCDEAVVELRCQRAVEKVRRKASDAEDGVLHHALHVLPALRYLKEERKTPTRSSINQRELCTFRDKPPIV